MFVKVLRLSQEERRHLLQENSIMCEIRSLAYICILCVLGSVHVQVVMYP